MLHPDFRGSLISKVETQKLQQISTSTESEIPLKGHSLKVRLFDLLEFCRFQKPVLLFHQVTNAPILSGVSWGKGPVALKSGRFQANEDEVVTVTVTTLQDWCDVVGLESS